MRLLDKTIMTEDEGWNLAFGIASQIREHLKRLKLDSYNNQYVVRVTVDQVDERVEEVNEEDKEEEE